jgi:hypothetical protein
MTSEMRVAIVWLCIGLVVCFLAFFLTSCAPVTCLYGHHGGCGQ